MSTSVALRCPDCKAAISTDLRCCIQCGADVGRWPESHRTPLILPGNPALRADVVRKRVSVPKIIVGTTAVAALAVAVLFSMPKRDVDAPPPLATTAEAEAPDVASRDLAAPPVVEVPRPLPVSADSLASDTIRAESLAAYSSGDTALSQTMQRVETAIGAPILALIPLVSSTLRAGERLQLRWTVTDRRTRRPVPGTRVEFTSADAAVADVDPVTGLVLARAPGTARIIIDAGTAGERSIELTVVAAPVVPPTPPTDSDLPRIVTPIPAPVPTATGAASFVPSVNQFERAVMICTE
jgi:hypothetical protein